MTRLNYYCLAYVFEPGRKYVATELQKIFEILGAFISTATARHVIIMNEDWSHTKGEVWRHEVRGLWYSKREMLAAQIITNNWLGGDKI